MNMSDSSNPDVRISQEWPAFGKRLAAVLSSMQEDQFLIILVKHTNRFIQFAAQGSVGTRAEVSCNAYLAKSEQLSEAQIAQLIEAGWNPPTGAPGESTPEKDPDGSPNFFIDYPRSVAASVIGDGAVEALSRNLRVPYPGFLEYEAFDAKGNSLVFGDLGLKRVDPADGADMGKLARRLLAAMREITEIQDLDYDGDGDIGIRFGSVSTFIRLVRDPAYVRFLAPLVRDVRETAQLHARLNELNCGVGHMHFFVRDGTIFAVSDTPASPLRQDHLTMALRRFCELADGIDDLLGAEFGGNASRPDGMPGALIH